MRERKRIRIKQAEVPMSSMIDVVFLLLIYFLVVHKPIVESTFLKSGLPDPTDRSKVKNPDFLRIDVLKHGNDDGHFYYRMNNRLWKDQNLFSYLEKAGQDNPDKPIIVTCGPNARHQKLITLLDACAEAQFTNINIVNDASIPFYK